MSNGSPEETVPLIIEDHYVEIEKSAAELLTLPPVKLTIDGREVEVPRATLARDPVTGQPVPRPTTIYDAALKLGISVPVLCHREHMTPVAVCRFCAVDVGPGRLTPACQRPVEGGMKVATAATSERVRRSVRVLAELLLADNNAPRQEGLRYGDNELRAVAKAFGLSPTGSRFPAAARDRGKDDSSPVIAVDHNACILCDRCVRACNEVRHNEVIGRAGKGYTARIAFDLSSPMGDSTCVACGECMVSCPTGALTSREPVGTDPWRGVTPRPQPVAAADLYSHPLFHGVSEPFLRWNEGSVVRRHFKDGDVICREGEFGSTAFVIESGEVEVSLRTPIKHLKARKGPGDKKDWGLFGLMRRFRSTLVGRAEDPREEEASPRFIPIDAPVALAYENPVARLGPEDVIFGEMTCMNHYPRSATVRAVGDVTVLEVLRNVLYILQRNKRSRDLLEQAYRRRAIDSHLRNVPVFAGLSADEAEFGRLVDFLRGRARLVRLSPGEVIFRQGDAADSMYLVRVGFVKVALRQPGGEHVLNYVGPGGYVGEIGLLAHVPEVGAPAGRRTATCSALDHVDLVRIGTEDFRRVLDDFPRAREEFVRVARQRIAQTEEARQRVEGVPLGEFLSQGLMHAQSLLVLDLEKCTRCDECTKACADAHDGVTRLVREGLRFDKYLVASSCRSCLDPYCMVGCPVGSIRRRGSREIIIEDWCIGCGKCAENCPYGNINMHPLPTGEVAPDPADPGRSIPVVRQKATMCDLCAELPDQQPSCVYACPHDAAHRMTGAELIRDVERRAGR
jgi:CRP-like cAMP-binding protein/Fe-S-cluster-containing hydrogenase component 2